MGERNSEVARRYPGAYYQGLDDPEPGKNNLGTPREIFLDLIGKAYKQPEDYNLDPLIAFGLKKGHLRIGDLHVPKQSNNLESLEEIAV